MTSRSRPLPVRTPTRLVRSAAARVFAAAALVVLLLLRFVAAHDHGHAPELSSSESCAVCLAGSLPLEEGGAVAALVGPAAAFSHVGLVACPAPALDRTSWLPPSCGPPAVAPPVST